MIARKKSAITIQAPQRPKAEMDMIGLGTVAMKAQKVVKLVTKIALAECLRA